MELRAKHMELLWICPAVDKPLATDCRSSSSIELTVLLTHSHLRIRELLAMR